MVEIVVLIVVILAFRRTGRGDRGQKGRWGAIGGGLYAGTFILTKALIIQLPLLPDSQQVALYSAATVVLCTAIPLAVVTWFGWQTLGRNPIEIGRLARVLNIAWTIAGLIMTWEIIHTLIGNGGAPSLWQLAVLVMPAIPIGSTYVRKLEGLVKPVRSAGVFAIGLSNVIVVFVVAYTLSGLALYYPVGLQVYILSWIAMAACVNVIFLVTRMIASHHPPNRVASGHEPVNKNRTS